VSKNFSARRFPRFFSCGVAGSARFSRVVEKLFRFFVRDFAG